MGVVMLAPLQAVCGEGKDFAEHMADFQFIEAVTCVYVDSATLAVVATLVYTAVAGSIYIRTNSMVIPFMLLLLIGGAVLTQMAAVTTPVAVLILLIVPGGVIAYAYYRYSL